MMKEDKKLLALSAQSAQGGDGIDDAEKAAVSEPQTGEGESLDAGDSRDKEAEFDALIENEYKKQFSEKVQKIISKRLREVKNMKEEQMMENKERQTELIRRLVEENRMLKKLHEEELQKSEARNRVQAWKTQAEETKSVYPEFDFREELSNPEFARLLRAGVDVRSAYEVANIDSILDRNTKNAERKVVDSIRSKGNRPVENGSESTPGILISGNVSKLDRKQRAELAKRAAKGEKISF